MMNRTDGEAFAEAVLQRVAELAYEELRPHLDRYAVRLQSTTSTTAPRTSSTPPAGVVSLDAHCGARRTA